MVRPRLTYPASRVRTDPQLASAALIARVVDEAGEVRAVARKAVLPWIAAEGGALGLHVLQAPCEQRPVGILVIGLRDLARAFECVEQRARKARARLREISAHGDHMHDGEIADGAEVIQLLRARIGEQATRPRLARRDGLGRMGQEECVHLAALQRKPEPLPVADVIHLHAGLGLNGDFLGRGEQPVDLLPRRVVMALEVAAREQRERGLEGAERDFFADEVARRPIARVRMHPHLAHAEQAARENRHADDRQVLLARDQEARERKLRDLVIALQHAPVPVRAVAQHRALADLAHVELEPVGRGRRAVEKRKMAVVAINADPQCELLRHKRLPCRLDKRAPGAAQGGRGASQPQD